MRHTLAALLLLIATTASAQWTRVAPGVDYRHIRHDNIDAHVTRIDLTNRKLRIVSTREEDRALTVSAFAKKVDALVAINGDYFNEEKIQPIGISLGMCGLWWNGIDVGRKQGLVAFGRKRAEIQQNTMNVEPWMESAVSGWPLLVRDCEVIENLPGSDHFTRAPHPRTAAGISKDGRTVYFVVTEGRLEGVPGLTLPELARFLHDELGVCRAMNLDGGGSSTMWVRNAVVNHPSDGFEREVGNHLAVVLARDVPRCKTIERRAKE
ncbi:MAG: phosphodiester glycosidase family protein [Acidobacteriota bacterium]|nr:phosphodiester glycosidase family protein [Acidobacteriota bacterium]